MRDHSVVIMHDPNLAHFFLGVVVGEIPALIIELRLDLLQPYFGRLVHGTLIDHGQKDFGRLILQRAGMRQHNINLPVALGEDALHLGFDFFGRLFIWEPVPTTGQTIVFIHAVGAADDNAGIAIEVIDLAVNGEQDIRIRAFSDAQGLIANLNATPSSQTRYQIYETQIDDAKRNIEKFNQLKAALYGDFADGLLSHQDYTDLSEDYSRRADDLRIFIAELEKEKEKYSVGFGSKMQWALLIEKYKDQESLDAEMAAAFIETLTLFNDGHVEVAFRHRDEIEQVLYVAATRGKEAERYAG